MVQGADLDQKNSGGSKMMKQQMCNESQNAELINEEIRSLTYRPEEVMAFSGENVTSFVPKTGKSVAEKFIVTTKTKHDMSEQKRRPHPSRITSRRKPKADRRRSRSPRGKTAPDESDHRSARAYTGQSCNRRTQRLHGSDRGDQ